MFYEDFKLNRSIQVGSHTVRNSEVDRFIDLIGLHNTIFLSDEGAQSLGHPRRVVPGPLQFSLAMGLGQKAGLFDHMVVGAQFDQLRFHRTLHPGDTLTMTALPVSKRVTSDPAKGIVVLEYRLTNQNDDVVVTTIGTYLFQTKAEAPGGSG